MGKYLVAGYFILFLFLSLLKVNFIKAQNIQMMYAVISFFVFAIYKRTRKKTKEDENKSEEKIERNNNEIIEELEDTAIDLYLLSQLNKNIQKKKIPNKKSHKQKDIDFNSEEWLEDDNYYDLMDSDDDMYLEDIDENSYE